MKHVRPLKPKARRMFYNPMTLDSTASDADAWRRTLPAVSSVKGARARAVVAFTGASRG